MDRIDEIITESISKVIKENRFKNKTAKMWAGAHAAERGGDIGAVEKLKNYFAQRDAISDMNKERRDSRSFQKAERVPTGILNNDYKEAGILSGSRLKDARDFFNSEDEFNGAITPDTFKDAESWLANRDNIEDLY